MLRNLITGADTFTELANGAPGLSRTLLSARLRELERVGVLTIEPHPHGRGHLYQLNPEDSDPGFLLHNWCHRYLAVELLPTRRVVARFEFTDQGAKQRQMWVIFDRAGSNGHKHCAQALCASAGHATWHELCPPGISAAYGRPDPAEPQLCRAR